MGILRNILEILKRQEEKEEMMDSVKHDCTCIICGKKENIQMIAHRNEKGEMVGWIFVCSLHIAGVADKYIVVAFQDKKK